MSRTDDFIAACKASGMVERYCEKCGTWYVTRSDSLRCPPCRGLQADLTFDPEEKSVPVNAKGGSA